METKITKIDSLLNLTIKSSGRGQNQLSALNSDDNDFPVGIKRKFSSDDSGIKQQNSGFERALKKKIDVDSKDRPKENESDELKENKSGNKAVHSEAGQIINVALAETVEQPEEKTCGDNMELLKEELTSADQTSQQQIPADSSDNSDVAETRMASGAENLPKPVYGTVAIEDQQAVATVNTGQDESSKIAINNPQLPKDNQLTNMHEKVQNKSSVHTDKANQSEVTVAKADDIVIKNTDETKYQLSEEKSKLPAQPQNSVTDTVKQAEVLSQFKNVAKSDDKHDDIKALKDIQNASQNNTKQSQMNEYIGTQLSDDTKNTESESYNTKPEIKANDIIGSDNAAKFDSVAKDILVDTNTPTNIQQPETNRGLWQTQNVENLSQTVAKQMFNSVNIALNRNQDQITVSLNPPELGRVTIKFIENQNQISGVLQVAKPQTRAELENALPQIIRSLESSGIQVKRIDVEVYDQNNINQQAPKDQNFQGSFFAKQDSEHNSGMKNTDDTGPQGRTAQNVSTENTADYQLNSALASESINLFA